MPWIVTIIELTEQAYNLLIGKQKEVKSNPYEIFNILSKRNN